MKKVSLNLGEKDMELVGQISTCSECKLSTQSNSGREHMSREVVDCSEFPKIKLYISDSQMDQHFMESSESADLLLRTTQEPQIAVVIVGYIKYPIHDNHVHRNGYLFQAEKVFQKKEGITLHQFQIPV